MRGSFSSSVISLPGWSSRLIPVTPLSKVLEERHRLASQAIREEFQYVAGVITNPDIRLTIKFNWSTHPFHPTKHQGFVGRSRKSTQKREIIGQTRRRLGLDVGSDQLFKLHKIEEKLRRDRLALEEEKEKFARYNKFIVQQIRDTQVQHQIRMKATIMEWQEQNNLLDRKDAILTQKKIQLEEVEEEVEEKYLDAGMLKMIGNSLVEVNTLRIKEELDALNKVFEKKLKQVELKNNMSMK
jgi:hypothetical protein